MVANVGPVPKCQPWPIAPAVAVMNRLTYPRKFALISLLFVTPLALVMGLLISEIDAQIGFARKEIQGIRYLRPCANSSSTSSRVDRWLTPTATGRSRSAPG